MMPAHPGNPGAAVQDRLREHWQQGGILAYPTEGVWGLGCDPHNPEALQRLLALKGRDSAKGLILVAASLAQIQPLLQGLSASQRARLEQDWPGFVTYLLPLPKPSPYPALLTGAHDCIAVRVSAHPVVQALCRQFGALVSTSANPSGLAAAMSSEAVWDYFGDRVWMVPGALGGAKRPSAIIDLISGAVIRAG